MTDTPILTIKGKARKMILETGSLKSKMRPLRGSFSVAKPVFRSNEIISVLNPNRRITVSANMYVEDDETWSSNETFYSQQTNSAILSAQGMPQTVMIFEVRMGGEIRVEFTVNANMIDNYGNVMVDAHARLYEGTSESTGDLDGQRDFVAYVPAGVIVNHFVRVNNDDEGGDFATIQMSITNNPA